MTTTTPQTGHAPVNGLQMYYERYGPTSSDGESPSTPLILIHGGFGVIGMFAELLPGLAEGRTVIGVELQAHGHTADIDRPFSYEGLADDVAGLIKHLGYHQADVLGFSLGGGVALQTAIRHPGVVRKLVVISAPYKREGWFPEILAGMGTVNAGAMVGTIMHDAYVSVAPNLDDFASLAHKTNALATSPYDWGQAVAGIQAPTLIIIGDADSIAPAHAAEMFALLGGGLHDAGWEETERRPSSQLAILPNTTHYTMLSRSDLLLPILTAFLDGSRPAAQ